MKGEGSFGYSRDEKATLRAFWQVARTTGGILVTTVLAYVWPGALREGLTVLSVIAVIFFGIAIQEAWRIWRRW